MLFISIAFVLVSGLIAIYIIRLVTKSIRESTPDFGKYYVKLKEKELLELAMAKKSKAREAKELIPHTPSETEKPEPKESDAVTEELFEKLKNAIGTDCPHCQTSLLEEDEMVICPRCKAVAHRVCFNLNGCINACAPNFVVHYPSGKAEKTRTLKG